MKLKMRFALIAGGLMLDQEGLSFVSDGLKVLNPLDRYFIKTEPEIPDNLEDGDQFEAECELDANGWLKEATEFYLKHGYDVGPLNGGPAGTAPMMLESTLKAFTSRPVDVKEDLYQSLICVRKLKNYIETRRSKPVGRIESVAEFEFKAFETIDCPEKFQPLLSFVIRHRFGPNFVMLMSAYHQP